MDPAPPAVLSRNSSGISSPSPMSRLQTHISFEELDDYVQMSPLSKWEYKLSIAFPSVVLSPDMIVTLCTAVRQSVKQVGHDCILFVDMDCTNSNLSDDSFSKLISEAAPAAMRKSGRVGVSKLALSGNRLTDSVISEIKDLAKLNANARYKYRTPTPVASGSIVDLSWNHIKEIASVEYLVGDRFVKIPEQSADAFERVWIDVENNFLDPVALQVKISALVADEKRKITLCSKDDVEAEPSPAATVPKCSKTGCVAKCRIHFVKEALVNQRDQIESITEETESLTAANDGFVTPPSGAEDKVDVQSVAVEEEFGVDISPSIEEMTKALLAGLKISPKTAEAKKPDAPSAGSAEDISRSLLNLLHASAATKTKEVSTPPPSSAMPQNVINLFAASKSMPAGQPAPAPASRGMSLADLEATLKTGTVTASGVMSQTLKPVEKVPPKLYTTVRVPLKVFTPFASATPLCGLELRVDQLGYRVVRVTEKPGQDGHIREGDVITAIDGEPLVALPGVAEGEREKVIRATFGKRLRDGVQLIIQRPTQVSWSDLNPDNATMVERKLDFGLMLLGAGIDWKNLAAKLPMAVMQAKLVCQSMGIEGKLEHTDGTTDTSPVLTLKGPAGLVDKAMRQFCVVIVKGALLQQQQENPQ